MNCPGVRLMHCVICIALLLCAGKQGNAQGSRQLDSMNKVLLSGVPDSNQGNILIAMSSSFKAGDVTKEFYYANRALDLSTAIGWARGRMKALVLVGDCYFRVNGYQDAVAHFRQAADEAKRTRNVNVETDCWRMLALCYRGMSDTGQMLQCQKTAMELARQNNNNRTECRMMRTYGLFLSEAGRYADAVAQEQLTIAYAQDHLADSELCAVTSELLNIKAGACIKLNRSDSALSCLRCAAGLAISCHSFSSLAYINSTFCDVYAAIKKYDSAIWYGQRAIEMGEHLNNLDLQQYYCKVLSSIFENAREPAMALAYRKRYDSLMALINNTQMKVDLALQVSKIDIQQENQRNELEKQSLNVIRRNQQLALTAAAVALAALAALVIFIYKNLRQKQRANNTISRQADSLRSQNEIIESALKEKEVLLKETHHRVKNNLQLISSLLELQATSLPEGQARAAIHTAQNRVLSIASVHNDLHGSDENERIELHGFAGELFRRLNGAFGGAAVLFRNGIPEMHLPLSKVVLLGLILNELITNSFKYSFAAQPEIHVSLTIAGNQVTIVYHDNGPGLPGNKFEQTSGSLGLYLVKRLVKQLKGNVTYHYDSGSTFTIHFHDGGS